MKPEEAIEEIRRLCCNESQWYPKGERKCKDNCMYGEDFCAFQMAIEALEEVQQYREIGSVEECRKAVEHLRYLKERRCGLNDVIEKCMEYEKIGTVEECREAREKQKPKKCNVIKDKFRIYYNCPTCNHNIRTEYNTGSWLGKKSRHCSNCGQAIQWDGNLK